MPLPTCHMIKLPPLHTSLCRPPSCFAHTIPSPRPPASCSPSVWPASPCPMLSRRVFPLRATALPLLPLPVLRALHCRPISRPHARPGAPPYLFDNDTHTDTCALPGGGLLARSRAADFRGPQAAVPPRALYSVCPLQPALLLEFSMLPRSCCQPANLAATRATANRCLSPYLATPFSSALPTHPQTCPSTCASVPTCPPLPAAAPSSCPLLLGTRTAPHDAARHKPKRVKPNPMLPAALYPKLALLLHALLPPISKLQNGELKGDANTGARAAWVHAPHSLTKTWSAGSRRGGTWKNGLGTDACSHPPMVAHLMPHSRACHCSITQPGSPSSSASPCL